ncbi:hypothetical protein [Bacillus tropicus]|uniref:hypothetical protein n=1 Tax=Bacillus tropicus TaxID=2026188 RepID=UPI0011A1207B|nr:hypothetical protein [Bacillus tropicus]
MKLTLFTISNEQIKEQLSKLQTKVESLETVKDVQDKMIATKDSQISFLEGQISTISTWVSIAGAAAGIIASLAFAYVTYLNRQAQKKVEQAESLITQNQQTATIAQEKLIDLEKMQSDLEKLTTSLSLNQKADMTLKNIDIKIKFLNNDLIALHQKINTKYPYTEENLEHYEKYHEFGDYVKELRSKYTNLSLMFNSKVIQSEEISEEDMTKITDLDTECIELKIEIAIYYENY